MKILLIHDTRSMGFLTGVIYSRLRTRLGDIIVPFFGPSTLRTQTFWEATCASLELDGIDEVVLCCMTFDVSNPERCRQRMEEIEARVKRPPVILSHRWPDGYATTKYEIISPPYDLVERYAMDLLPEERELLRLSTVISRQASRRSVSESDLLLAEKLSAAINQRPKELWETLHGDLAKVRQELRASPDLDLASCSMLGSIDLHDKAFALFTLVPSAKDRAEKTIEAIMNQHRFSDQLGIGILNVDDNLIYAYVVRPWAEIELPSVEWLIHEFAERYQLGKPDLWMGPPDAQHLLLARAGLTARDLPSFKTNLIHFAEAAYATRSGGRKPVGGLVRLVDSAASSALSSLDLLRRYTKGSTPALRFEPLHAQVRVEPSHRTGSLRSTLILHLQIETSEAAAFLFGNGGYNFLKLERLLEGVLIGIASDRSRWLDSFEVPQRLRVDTHFSQAAVDDLSSALGTKGEVATSSLEQAIAAGFLTKDSTIARVLAAPPCGDPGTMIVFHESETIGPSVPYAFVVGALAERLGMEKGHRLDVLDLFSGSGLSARAVLAKQQNWRVCCVDLSISAKQAGLSNLSSVVWLKADVKQVLSGEEGILDRQFDMVCMDPPHGALLEILFAQEASDRPIIGKLAQVSPWLVVYQGHVSQAGRGRVLQMALTKYFECVTLWRIGPEVVTIAGPEVWHQKEFSEITSVARGTLLNDCKQFGWDVVDLGGPPRNASNKT